MRREWLFSTLFTLLRRVHLSYCGYLFILYRLWREAKFKWVLDWVFLLLLFFGMTDTKLADWRDEISPHKLTHESECQQQRQQKKKTRLLTCSLDPFEERDAHITRFSAFSLSLFLSVSFVAPSRFETARILIADGWIIYDQGAVLEMKWIYIFDFTWYLIRAFRITYTLFFFSRSKKHDMIDIKSLMRVSRDLTTLD